jgi:PAS domain S-box-containing protein
MFGWTTAEMIGRPMATLVPKRLLDRGELARIREAVVRDGFVAGYETERLTRDGRLLTVNITSTAIHDRSGNIIGRSAILRDVTTMRRMQDELARTQSLATVGELAASVAHEIKNPLAGISGAIQVIVDSIPPKDPRREIVSEILAQIRRLDDTVRDLLVFAKPWTPEMTATDAVDVIDRVATQVRQEPGRQGILVRRETPATLPLEADPRQLQEVLLNLVHNAADSMPQGGCIRIVGTADDGHVVVRVIDTGGGIHPDHHGRLFRPFFTTKTRGTGLGLAISKKIIEAHGGRIDIESEPGRGTEVRIALPKEHGHGVPSAGR